MILSPLNTVSDALTVVSVHSDQTTEGARGMEEECGICLEEKEARIASAKATTRMLRARIGLRGSRRGERGEVVKRGGGESALVAL